MSNYFARTIAASALVALMGLAPAAATEPAKTSAVQTRNLDMETKNKAAVEAVLTAWKNGDGGALQPLLSDDIEWTITGNSAASGTTKGRAELMQKVLGPFGARFNKSSDRFRPTKIYGVYADGDVVTTYFDGAGTANNGFSYKNSYVWLLTLKDGKVVKATAFFDSIAFNELWDKVEPAQN